MMPKLTHKGLFCGIVPVYLDMSDEDMPMMCVRHWSLEPLLDVVEMLFGMCVFLRSLAEADYEPMYPIKITGEFNGEAR